MSQTEIGFIGVGVLIFLLMMGVHVGFAMIVVGVAGYAAIGGFDAALNNLPILTFDKLNAYHFAVLPLFLLMSSFISVTNIGSDAYMMARAWLGKFKGGLAMATIAACGLFAAVSGTSLAGSVVMGKVAYPEMKKLGYKDRLSGPVISAGGTLGILIPPSMGFVLLGILAELSIGKLFIAGIIPGVIVVLVYMLTVVVLCKFKPDLAPMTATTTWKEKFSSIKLTWPIALLFIIIMGGIYGGVFTATEAGAIGAFGALIIGLARRELKGGSIWYALQDAAQLTAMITAMLVGAYLFNAFLAITQIPYTISEFLAGLAISKYVILVLIIVFYIVCGMLFDIVAIIILTVPILYPAIDRLGFDLIWYSVIMVRMIEIGQITPPFGINLFGLVNIIKVPLATLYKGIWPFIVCDLATVAVLCVFPILSTWLPGIM
ncbi:MAG: TRAP transporter large permease [Dehalococcoidales bacterium]|nr:TRAP transporter large permease [Dehalococcoidales bacterium]